MFRHWQTMTGEEFSAACVRAFDLVGQTHGRLDVALYADGVKVLVPAGMMIKPSEFAPLSEGSAMFTVLDGGGLEIKFSKLQEETP